MRDASVDPRIARRLRRRGECDRGLKRHVPSTHDIDSVDDNYPWSDHLGSRRSPCGIETTEIDSVEYAEYPVPSKVTRPDDDIIDSIDDD